ncbi:polar amino acid transport system substrate-binding protein [Streptomyces sp. SAI-170]|uniref:glutamate ABC transporter substrate-binding protein n=1 Tax=Streptomyces sp. SAI-170 TaxID=3377729 RepID=UPI003C7A38D3
MRARQLRAGLRGWGGVGAMAVVCAVAAVFALLLPLTQPHGDGSTGVGGPGLADGTQVRADDCEAPQNQSLAPSSAEGASVAAIKKRGYLSVGVDQNSYRWGYRNPNSTDEDVQLEGFDIDLARRIATDLLGSPDKIRFKAIPTNQRVPAIQSGRVDMVVRTMTITCARLEQVAFSAPYFLTGQQVLAPVSSDIEGYDGSLAGKQICSAAGSTAYDKLDEDKKAGKLDASADISTTVPNQLDCLVRLQLGQVDAVVTDSALAASQAAQDPTVELKGERFTTEYYGVAMNQKATDLVRRVNRILEQYRTDPDGWRASYDHWLRPTLGADSESATAPVPTYQ